MILPPLRFLRTLTVGLTNKLRERGVRERMREEGRDPSDHPTSSFSTSPSSPFTEEVGEKVIFKPYDKVCTYKNATISYKMDL